MDFGVSGAVECRMGVETKVFGARRAHRVI
jgi:hypothetical protein